MKQMVRRALSHFKKIMANPRQKKSWQSGIGIAIFTLFVLSSVLVSQSVQALNIAAGNYGYYAGTYGYNSTDESSDYVPSAPTSLTSSVTTSSVTFSWTAPTTTTGSTSLDNLSGYCYTYGTSSKSTCELTDSTTSSASVTISGLTCGSTEYIAVRAYDANQNLSDALTGSATITACAGNAPSGGSSGPSTGPSYPTATTTTTTTTTTTVTTVTTTVAADAVQLTAQLGVQRDTTLEVAYQAKVVSSASEFKVTLGTTDLAIATNFVTYGTASQAVHNMGSGERLALVRDQLETLGRVSLTALEQLANGQKPTERNLSKEVGQLKVALRAFEKMTGHRPNFKNVKEDMAWNTLMYRIRFTRNLNQERVGIIKFRVVYSKTPTAPFDWAVVRAWGYQLGVK